MNIFEHPVLVELDQLIQELDQAKKYTQWHAMDEFHHRLAKCTNDLATVESVLVKELARRRMMALTKLLRDFLIDSVFDPAILQGKQVHPPLKNVG